MDEEIEFVQVLQMPGTRKNKVTFNLSLNTCKCEEKCVKSEYEINKSLGYINKIMK